MESTVKTFQGEETGWSRFEGGHFRDSHQETDEISNLASEKDDLNQAILRLRPMFDTMVYGRSKCLVEYIIVWTTQI